MKTFRAKIFFEGYKYVQFEAKTEKAARKLLDEEKIEDEDVVEETQWVSSYDDLNEVTE